MKSFLSRTLVITIICSALLYGQANADELVLLQGDGLKRDVTLSDMQKYVGGLADVSQKTWEAFIGQMPGVLSVAKDSMNAIAIHQQLSKGSISGAAKSVLDYGIGFISGEWESAGYGPLASMMTAFSVYDASLDFIHSQWFMPSLVDSVYGKYKSERDEGQTHEAVWENFGTYFIQPIKAEVKDKVIYPRHNLKNMGDDKSKATRWVLSKVGPKAVKVTCMDRSNWPYSETQKVYIRHKGKGTTPLFETAIDIEVWDLQDIDGLTLDIMTDLYKLNDIKYPNLKNRFTVAQMEELEGKLGNMLKELKDRDIGPELDAEAEEYIGQMLEVRYAKEAAEKFKSTTDKVKPQAEKDLLDIARQLKEFVPDLEKTRISFDGYSMDVPSTWDIRKNPGDNPKLQVLGHEENALLELYANKGEKTGLGAYANSVEKLLEGQPYLKNRGSAGSVTLPNGVEASLRRYTGEVQGKKVDAAIICAYSEGVWYVGLGVYRSSMADILSKPVMTSLKSLTIEKTAPGPQTIVGTWEYTPKYDPENLTRQLVFKPDGMVDVYFNNGSVSKLAWKETGKDLVYRLGYMDPKNGKFVESCLMYLSEDGNSILARLDPPEPYLVRK